MSSPSVDQYLQQSQRKLLYWSILCSLLIGALAVTHQSLWIDEANSAAKAVQPSLGKWWSALITQKGSDLQMPFYMFYLWSWSKVFGISEIALRAANIPWFAIGIGALAWGFSDRRLKIAVTVLTLIQASLWYYLSEARPYIVLFAFSALTVACLLRLHQDKEGSLESRCWFRLLCLGILGMCATNLIAVPWAIAAMIAVVFWIGPSQSFRTIGQSYFASTLTALLLITLAIFYLWTLRIGARASEVGRTQFATLIFSGYELLGLAGLGPGRIALREGGASAILPYLWPIIAGVLAVFSLAIATIPQLWKKVISRDILFFGIAVAIPTLLLAAAGGIAHVRILGRHLVPALPFILAFFAIGYVGLFDGGSRWRRVVGILVTAILLISALEIRVCPRHQRDDYRSAAGLAQSAIARGETVWWAADTAAASYYGLQLNSSNPIAVANPNQTELNSRPTPDLVVLSKPDIYDAGGELKSYLQNHNFRVTRTFAAFVIFQPTQH